MNKLLELYGASTEQRELDWEHIAADQQCPYLGRKCLKNRKSDPEQSIGTCSVQYGRDDKRIIICPARMLQRQQIFMDSFHLMTTHEPGNEIHVLPEISIPGGSVDYFLVSVRDARVRDFVGIEIQTLDTTGTVWPTRHSFLDSVGVKQPAVNDLAKSFGMNWKMTAKTILVQLHHKVQTFEHVNKHLVLVMQDHLLDYMRANFDFGHLSEARIGDSMHFHSYRMQRADSGRYSLDLGSRHSTDTRGIARSLGLKANANVELQEIVAILESKLSEATLLQLGA